MTDADRLVSLDGESYYQDPAGTFARLRECRPVAPALVPGFGRAWVVTRYADVRAALADPRLAKDVRQFPGGGRSRPSEAAGGVHAHVLNTDPPDHTRARRVQQRVLTPRRAELLRPRAREVAAGLLDEMTARGGTTDLLKAYARPLPVTVICELLGIPARDRAWILAAVIDYGRPGQADRVSRELAGYLAALIAAKTAAPGADLVSELLLVPDGPGEDGEEDWLNGTELLSNVYHLVMAGFDTTANLIASGTLALLGSPEEMDRLRGDPSLLPAAVEELLRFTSPVNHATPRFTTQDCPIGGVVIPKGEWVLAATCSANRDPARFPGPDRLDFGRDPGGHVTFGYGIHYCLGAPLARMEAEVAIGALLERFPRLSLAVPPEEVRWRSVSLMNGLESLPVRLEGPGRP